jgi:hypothetical protein
MVLKDIFTLRIRGLYTRDVYFVTAYKPRQNIHLSPFFKLSSILSLLPRLLTITGVMLLKVMFTLLQRTNRDNYTGICLGFFVQGFVSVFQTILFQKSLFVYFQGYARGRDLTITGVMILKELFTLLRNMVSRRTWAYPWR